MMKYLNKINEDNTIYSLVLQKNNIMNKDAVILLMNITGLNILFVSDILKNKCPYELLKGKATEIKDISIRLDECGIIYDIVPKFPWKTH